MERIETKHIDLRLTQSEFEKLLKTRRTQLGKQSILGQKLDKMGLWESAAKVSMQFLGSAETRRFHLQLTEGEFARFRNLRSRLGENSTLSRKIDKTASWQNAGGVMMKWENTRRPRKKSTPSNLHVLEKR